MYIVAYRLTLGHGLLPARKVLEAEGAHIQHMHTCIKTCDLAWTRGDLALQCLQDRERAWADAVLTVSVLHQLSI